MSLDSQNCAGSEAAPAAGEVQYPAEFHFRIIADAARLAERELQVLLAAYCVTSPLADGRVSARGAYRSLSVSVRMRSREEMLAFDGAVKRVSGVRMLL